MRFGLDLPGHSKDDNVDRGHRMVKAWADSFEGDQVGPFDHPEGIGADQPFDVAHALGQVPGATLVVEDPGYTGKGVYATSDDRARWNAETITLRSSDPTNKNIVIRLRRRTDA